MAKEVWKDIPDYEGKYQASLLGNIRSFKCAYRLGKRKVATLKQKSNKRKNWDGCYKMVTLWNPVNHPNYFYVHRLIAMTFIGKCPKDYVVNHKDFDGTNNDVKNLEYVTRKQNHLYTVKHKRHAFGERNSHASLNEDKVREILNLRDYSEIKKMAKKFKVTTKTIKNVIKRKTWKYVQL